MQKHFQRMHLAICKIHKVYLRCGHCVDRKKSFFLFLEQALKHAVLYLTLTWMASYRASFLLSEVEPYKYFTRLARFVKLTRQNWRKPKHSEMSFKCLIIVNKPLYAFIFSNRMLSYQIQKLKI